MIRKHSIILGALLVAASVTFAQEREQGDKREASVFNTQVPQHLYNIIAGRPTNHSVTISIMANENISGNIEYGLNEQKPDKKTTSLDFAAGKTSFIELTDLLPDKKYFYRLAYESKGKKEKSDLCSFHTQRSPASAFTFCIQADSHLDENAGTDVYTQTLKDITNDSPDFLIDLGDTWMADKYRDNFKASLNQYVAQRYYFGLAGKNMSVFNTLGNHDGEQGKGRRGTEEMLGWCTAQRHAYYANPYPDGFYTGNTDKTPDGRYAENYYAWQWGNALFIVLDPFRNTMSNKDPWQRTLGATQYNWLKNLLQSSKAKFKFVFIHNLVGGVDAKGIARGGAEASKFYEWGGQNADGSNGFAANRAGWEKPIHDLLVQYKVNAVFHGHDHLFVKQDKDGLVYQTVPQPGATRYGNTNSAAEYGYLTGVIKNTPGYIRVKLSAEKATVEYVQTSLDAQHKNGEVLYSYVFE